MNLDDVGALLTVFGAALLVAALLMVAVAVCAPAPGT